jgi:hypothetical protein
MAADPAMSWSVDAQNHLLARQAVMPRWLLWVAAKEFGTLTAAPVGLWTGEDNLTFTIGGASRVYQGALSRFEIEPITYGTGLDVRTLQITLAANAPETEDLVRGFVIRLAAVELHLALLDPVTTDLIDVQPMFRGFINRAPLSTPAMGGGDSVTLELVSRLRTLALPGPALKKTDSAMRLREATDSFRQYGSIATEVQTEWVKS